MSSWESMRSWWLLLVVNLIGSRITLETNLWGYLQGISRLGWGGETYPTCGWWHSVGWGPRLHGKEVNRAQVLIPLCFLSGCHAISWSCAFPVMSPSSWWTLLLPSAQIIFFLQQNKQLIQCGCRVGLNSRECLQSSRDCVGRVTACQDGGMYL